jgi:tRNA dimethylallyltransferase
LRNGVIEETQTLLQTYPKCASLLQVTLGYQQVLAFLSGSISRNELKELWALKEYQYAKRQLTWFKKNDRIHWFDIQDPGIDTAIINLLQSWN